MCFNRISYALFRSINNKLIHSYHSVSNAIDIHSEQSLARVIFMHIYTNIYSMKNDIA